MLDDMLDKFKSLKVFETMKINEQEYMKLSDEDRKELETN